MDKSEEALLNKYNESKSFVKEMDEADKTYATLFQQGQYCDLSEYSQEIINKISIEGRKQDQAKRHLRTNDSSSLNPKDICFYYGSMQPQTNGKIQKLMIHFIKNFPKPKTPYTLIYLNNFASPNAAAAFADFKKMFLMLPLEYFRKLRKFIILKQTLFFQKDIFYWGVLSKYLKDKTLYLASLEKISQDIGIEYETIVIFLPEAVAYDLQIKDYLQITGKNKGNSCNQRGNVKGLTTLSKLHQRQRFDTLFQKQMLGKQGKQLQRSSYLQKKQIMSNSCQISDYELNQIGIPLLLNILIAYFKQKPEGLTKEGIFRKSVSIDDQNKIMIHVANKDYDYLSSVSDPHLIANLIKRFLAGLRTPIIPYHIFAVLMQNQKLETVKENISLAKLKRVNYISLLYLFQFLKEEVITRQKQNKMSIEAVSVCFAPCLMRAEVSSIQDLVYAGKSVTVLKVILENFEAIFGNKKQQQKSYRKSFFMEKRKQIELTKLRISKQSSRQSKDNTQSNQHGQIAMEILKNNSQESVCSSESDFEACNWNNQNQEKTNCVVKEQGKNTRLAISQIQQQENQDQGNIYQKEFQREDKSYQISTKEKSQPCKEKMISSQKTTREAVEHQPRIPFKSAIQQQKNISNASLGSVSQLSQQNPRHSVKIEQQNYLHIQGLDTIDQEKLKMKAQEKEQNERLKNAEQNYEEPQLFIALQPNGYELYFPLVSQQTKDNRFITDHRHSYYQDLNESLLEQKSQVKQKKS